MKGRWQTCHGAPRGTVHYSRQSADFDPSMWPSKAAEFPASSEGRLVGRPDSLSLQDEKGSDLYFWDVSWQREIRPFLLLPLPICWEHALHPGPCGQGQLVWDDRASRRGAS